MTKREQEEREFQGEALRGLGFDWEEISALRRINGTLRAWNEAEANGEIQRDGEDGEGKPRRFIVDGMGNVHRCGLVADRERGALKRGAGKQTAGEEIVRLARAMDEHNAKAGRAVLTAEGGKHFLQIGGGEPVQIVTPEDWTDSVRAGFCPAKARDIAAALGLELVEG